MSSTRAAISTRLALFSFNFSPGACLSMAIHRLRWFSPLDGGSTGSASRGARAQYPDILAGSHCAPIERCFGSFFECERILLGSGGSLVRTMWRQLEGGIPCAFCGAPIPPTQRFCGACGVAVASMRNSVIPSIRPMSERAGPPETQSRTIHARSRQEARVVDAPVCRRERDLAWLEGRRTEAKAAFGVLLVGDSGIGKTRLVGEFLEIARAAGDVVVQTGPDPSWREWLLRASPCHRTARTAPDDGGGSRTGWA